jgi:polysaccharide biosynthesis protein PslG
VKAVTRKLALAALALLALAPPATAGAVYAPRGFIGISPQGRSEASDFELMELAGIESVRVPMAWSAIQPDVPAVTEPNWSGFDRAVGFAAEHGIRVFPFLSSSPEWVAAYPTSEPVESAWQRWAWTSFLREAVERYGPRGEFWEENPELPFLPIRRWEIWNEENIVTFAHRPNPERFAKLVRLSGRVLHAADPGAKVILGGLFGRPLQVPPNVRSGDFLSRLYRARPIKRFFDGVALHPYVANAGAIWAQIANLRRIMRVHNDAATPLYVTELGWGSDSFESRWERGLYGQARELDRAFAMLAAQRLRWRIGGVWWFSWTDEEDACQFCDSAGLLTNGREAKPAWYRFNAWTGGDPDTVPRAVFGD